MCTALQLAWCVLLCLAVTAEAAAGVVKSRRADRGLSEAAAAGATAASHIQGTASHRQCIVMVLSIDMVYQQEKMLIQSASAHFIRLMQMSCGSTSR
jgi:hypothetical protein